MSFGTFIFFIIFGAFISQIARIFISDSSLEEIVRKTGWSLAFFSPIGFELFILTKDFGKIVNLKIVVILMILNLLAITIAVLTPTTRSIAFFVAILIVILNGGNLLRFEVLLVKNSYGKIKKKLRLFLIGTITSLISLVFAITVGLGVLDAPFLELVMYYIGVSILIIGFLIIFFSAYDFPPFYEFEWRENLSKLIIINPATNASLFYYDFTELFNLSEDKNKSSEFRGDKNQEKLISGGIIGIDSVISGITGTKHERIDKIEKEDSQILLEYGIEPTNLIYAMIIKKDVVSLRHLLRNIRIQFESFYREILRNLDSSSKNQDLLFGSFDLILENIIK
ncbi:MAG: hypothetical protein KGD61_11035 [Candidatus Lokiarchaeota archaeon]|nr:hypothetical protein [Candidatus Lokiarchaeota archaeon]